MLSNLTQQKILTTIERLRQLTQINVQTHWHIGLPEDHQAETLQAITSTWKSWPIAEINQKQHIAWPQGRKVVWLAQKLIVPELLHGFDLTGCSLRLVLRWWAEVAEIYLNQTLIGSGDLFDCFTRILLSESVRPGDEFSIILKLISPGHDPGALVQSVCQYELIQKESTQKQPGKKIEEQPIDPGLLADEIEIIHLYLTQTNQELEHQFQKLERLEYSLGKIDWSVLLQASPQKNSDQNRTFQTSLLNCYQELLKIHLHNQLKLKLIGHAHLDLAWLWPIYETWEAAQRTFESVLNLQQEFPELIFCHSTPALYEWIEHNRPDLFQAIQQKVYENRWEVTAGLWVEPELNIISGESIVRQVLYGQLYTQEKFGQIAKVAWLPDSFGFCWQLPQILCQGGIKYFVTQKLRWNDTTQFPYELFQWQSPDGSRILSYMSALIGEIIDPIKMIKYGLEWQQKTQSNSALWLPGVGDHGGGPTRDMLQVSRRWQNSPFFPEQEFITVERYLDECVSHLTSAQLPVWNDELYLEFHRGCYTSHADQKYWNRRCERLLYQAELWASIATIKTGSTYPKSQIETAWKKALFNQFHDILPGSAIQSVYEDANRTWQEAASSSLEILHKSLTTICQQINLPAPPQIDSLPIVVFNSLNWQRSEIVTLEPPDSEQSWQILTSSGECLETQWVENKLLFRATDVPSIGYRVFWLVPEPEVDSNQDMKETVTTFSMLAESGRLGRAESQPPKSLPQEAWKGYRTPWRLENEFLIVEVSDQTGELLQVFDKLNQREVLRTTETYHLQFFQDQGQYWDAWNINPDYPEHPLPPAELQSIQWMDQGQLQQRLRVIRKFRNSEFCQDYILQSGSPVLTVENTVDWHETHVLVKVAFPLNLTATVATCEMPCGVIQRSTQPQTALEKAKWEIPAMNWVELNSYTSDSNPNSSSYGVSIFSDYKTGYDLQPSQIRLSLLRGSTWPDPIADQGIHHFTYGLYPHGESWQQANVNRHGYAFNQPLTVELLTHEIQTDTQALDRHSFLDLEARNLILMALKQSERNETEWIFRCYESEGKPVRFSPEGELKSMVSCQVDLLEEPIVNQESFQIDPWKIASFKLR
ncbi:MAG: alpha-mannosidase [Microcoleaceae cyanobacterium]